MRSLVRLQLDKRNLRVFHWETYVCCHVDFYPSSILHLNASFLSGRDGPHMTHQLRLRRNDVVDTRRNNVLKAPSGVRTTGRDNSRGIQDVAWHDLDNSILHNRLIGGDRAPPDY